MEGAVDPCAAPWRVRLRFRQGPPFVVGGCLAVGDVMVADSIARALSREVIDVTGRMDLGFCLATLRNALRDPASAAPGWAFLRVVAEPGIAYSALNEYFVSRGAAACACAQIRPLGPKLGCALVGGPLGLCDARLLLVMPSQLRAHLSMAEARVAGLQHWTEDDSGGSCAPHSDEMICLAGFVAPGPCLPTPAPRLAAIGSAAPQLDMGTATATATSSLASGALAGPRAVMDASSSLMRGGVSAPQVVRVHMPLPGMSVPAGMSVAPHMVQGGGLLWAPSVPQPGVQRDADVGLGLGLSLGSRQLGMGMGVPPWRVAAAPGHGQYGGAGRADLLGGGVAPPAVGGDSVRSAADGAQASTGLERCAEPEAGAALLPAGSHAVGVLDDDVWKRAPRKATPDQVEILDWTPKPLVPQGSVPCADDPSGSLTRCLSQLPKVDRPSSRSLRAMGHAIAQALVLAGVVHVNEKNVCEAVKRHYRHARCRHRGK